MKAWFAKLISGGAGYVILILLAIGTIKLFADHYYDKGVEDCQAAQAAEDDKVSGLEPEISAALDESKDQAAIERVEIRKEYHTGITIAQVNQARAEGEVQGRKDARNEVYDEIRRKGGCITVDYDPDDKLLINARSQQDRFLRAGIGQYKDGKAGAELPGKGRGNNAVSGDPAGEDQQPD